MDQTNIDFRTERKTASRRSLQNPIRCFDGQLGIGTAFRFFRLASQPTETLVPFNVTWSGYSAVQIVVAEASAYNSVFGFTPQKVRMAGGVADLFAVRR